MVVHYILHSRGREQLQCRTAEHIGIYTLHPSETHQGRRTFAYDLVGHIRPLQQFGLRVQKVIKIGHSPAVENVHSTSGILHHK